MSDDTAEPMPHAESTQPQKFGVAFWVPILVCAAILAAIIWPNFVSQQRKAKVAQVKSDMHTAQLALESYTADTAGQYPGTPNEARHFLERYYPGAKLPQGFIIVSASQLHRKTVSELRNADAAWLTNQFKNATVAIVVFEDHQTYAVIGIDGLRRSVAGNAGQMLVLSNQ